MQAVAGALRHLPVARAWIRECVSDATAMDLVACDPSLIANPAAVTHRSLPDVLTQKLHAVAAGGQSPPREALLVLPLLAVLCTASLPDLLSFWADTLVPLLPLLQAHPACSVDSLLSSAVAAPAGVTAAKAPRSVPTSRICSPTTRSQHVCWLAGCALSLHEQQDAGVGSVVGSLNDLLPQLLPGLIRPLPVGLKDWASAEPLCDVGSPAFAQLRTSGATRGRITAALAIVAATTADPVCTARAVAVAHERGAMYVLPRAVATAATWMHGARAAAGRGHTLGEARCPIAAAAEADQALGVLHEACRAMCAMAIALLARAAPRSATEQSERMHGRWRTVCHVLLVSYHAVHWCPQNIEVSTAVAAVLVHALRGHA